MTKRTLSYRQINCIPVQSKCIEVFSKVIAAKFDWTIVVLRKRVLQQQTVVNIVLVWFISVKIR